MNRNFNMRKLFYILTLILAIALNKVVGFLTRLAEALRKKEYIPNIDDDSTDARIEGKIK